MQDVYLKTTHRGTLMSGSRTMDVHLSITHRGTSISEFQVPDVIVLLFPFHAATLFSRLTPTPVVPFVKNFVLANLTLHSTVF
jgi:hypothetical protein